jgi:hypothetical protein
MAMENEPILRAALLAVAEAIESGALEEATCPHAVLNGRAQGAEAVFVADQLCEVSAAGVWMPAW